jgi:hypothetical protein
LTRTPARLASLTQCSLARARWLVLVAVCSLPCAARSRSRPLAPRARRREWLCSDCVQTHGSQHRTKSERGCHMRCAHEARAEQAAHAHHNHQRSRRSQTQLVRLVLDGRTRSHPCATHTSTAISARAIHTRIGRARRVPELVGVGDYPIARPMSLNARLARIGTTPSSARRRSRAALEWLGPLSRRTPTTKPPEKRRKSTKCQRFTPFRFTGAGGGARDCAR